MHLYEIRQQYRDVFDSSDNLAFIEDEGERAAAQTDMEEVLNGLESRFEEKAEAVAVHQKELKADIETLKAERKELDLRIKRKEAELERWEEYLKHEMQEYGARKIETSKVVILIKTNSPAVKIADENEFIAWAECNADKYLRYKLPEIDKTAVKNDIKEGHTVPGAVLESSTSVVIR